MLNDRVTFRQLRALLRADLYRYAGNTGLKAWARHFGFTPGFKYTVWMRSCGWARQQPVARYTIFPLLKWILLRCRYKYGIAIPEYTRIGPGFFINRFGGIYIHHDAVIGCNVNLTHGTVLGHMNRGRNEGAPILGDRVFLGSGAKVIGKVRVGNDAAIGVNCVVTKPVDDMGVAVGIPGKTISHEGSDGYINRKASPAMIAAAGWTEDSL
jgi:serine O-acetyltransferase